MTAASFAAKESVEFLRAPHYLKTAQIKPERRHATRWSSHNRVPKTNAYKGDPIGNEYRTVAHNEGNYSERDQNISPLAE